MCLGIGFHCNPKSLGRATVALSIAACQHYIVVRLHCGAFPSYYVSYWGSNYATHSNQSMEHSDDSMRLYHRPRCATCQLTHCRRLETLAWPETPDVMTSLRPHLMAMYDVCTGKSGLSDSHDELLRQFREAFMHQNALNPAVFPTLRYMPNYV
jgi:hypothetical protein